MNGNQSIRTAGRIGAFFARHSLAVLVTVFVPCLLWTIAYFALLIWALFSSGGMGSPVVYPIGLLLILVGGTGVAIALFLPATALAEWIGRRHGLPVLAQIPISVAILALLCVAIAAIATATGTEPTFQGFSMGIGFLFLAHLLPLGIYWWVAQSGPLLLSLLQSLRSKLRL